MSIDPLANKYPGMSPYAYVANNPLKYTDPDGRKIVNPYAKYKHYAGLEQQLKNNISNASSRSERRAARKELRANGSNIQGYNNYQEVQGLIADFKNANESEYNRLDNLKLNGVDIDVVVNLSSDAGDTGQHGDTKYAYDPNGVINVSEYKTGESYQLPTKIVDDEIGIILYYRGRTLSTLANEFGDAIFGVENPRAGYQDAENNTSYWRMSATKFSFDYQDYIMKGGDKPNPGDY